MAFGPAASAASAANQTLGWTIGGQFKAGGTQAGGLCVVQPSVK